MTYFFWYRNLCRLTFVSAFGMPMPIVGCSHEVLVGIRKNALPHLTKYYCLNAWIWEG